MDACSLAMMLYSWLDTGGQDTTAGQGTSPETTSIRLRFLNELARVAFMIWKLGLNFIYGVNWYSTGEGGHLHCSEQHRVRS